MIFKKRGKGKGKGGDERRPLTRDKIIEYLDGVLARGGDEERWIQEQLANSDKDRAFFEAVREEVETQNLSISLVWRQERVSCPHRDLLEAHFHGSLSEAESDYVRFHIDRVGCLYCSANLDDIAALDRAVEDPPVRDLRDELLRSTTAFLRGRD